MPGMRTVGEVTELTGVTVRTLHHYDEIGLLRPSGRTDAGYRLYSYADLARLQEILGWRAFGFGLGDIAAMLDDPAHDRLGTLRRQRELVEREAERLGALGRALDDAIEAEEKGQTMSEQVMFEGFDPTEYEDEARERWGDTEAYRESARRTAAYGETEWREIRAEWDAIVAELAAVMAAGEPADSERACAAAERHRQHISRWFYDCPPAMHRGLGALSAEDSRFAANYDRVAPGLATYVRGAFAANAELREASTP